MRRVSVNIFSGNANVGKAAAYERDGLLPWRLPPAPTAAPLPSLTFHRAYARLLMDIKPRIFDILWDVALYSASAAPFSFYSPVYICHDDNLLLREGGGHGGR